MSVNDDNNSANEKRLYKVKGWLMRNICYYMPAVILTVVMVCIFVAENITPFGDNSLTIVDSIHQYVPFFSEYRDKLLNGDNLFYTWNVALGMNFLSLASYYLSSPFNLLLLLFPKKYLVAGVCIIVSLKIVLSGTTMAYFLGHTGRKKSEKGKTGANYYIIGLAISYALSNYVVGYYWNTMWMDCIMIFPLIVLGFERLMEEKKPLLYCLTLFYALFCNYYIGFMICVFLVLWFFTYNHGGIKKLFTNGLRFALCSLIGGGMSAMLLIPAYFGIKATAAGKTELPKWSFYDKFSYMFGQQFILTEPITNQTFDGGVNLYCGALVLLTFMMLLICRSIKLSEKIKYVLLLAFMAISFNTTTLNYIWHGFHDQYGIPNRFSFLYIFILLLIANRVLENLKAFKTVHITISLILTMIGIAVCYIMNELNGKNLSVYCAIITALIVILYAALMVIWHYRLIGKTVFSIVLGVFISAEMIFSGVHGFVVNGYADYGGHYMYSDQTQKAWDRVKELETENGVSFCRAELLHGRVLDEATWYNMPSLGTFCSTVGGDLVTTMGRLGFYTGANEFLYKGATPFTNSLLNIRYLLARPGDLINPDFNYVESVDGVDIYENPYPTAIGMAVNITSKDWERDGAGRFFLQNALINDMTGMPGAFLVVYPSVSCESLETSSISIDNDLITFTPKQAGELKHRETFTVETPGDYYVNCRGNYVTKLRIVINGEEYAYDRYQLQLFHLGNLEQGDQVSIEYCYDNIGAEQTTASLAIAIFNPAAYDTAYNRLSRYMLNNVVVDGNHVEGTIDMPAAATLFLSIPYDKGWSVKVDGKKTDYYKFAGAFIGVDIGKGTHMVELDYVPIGFKLGAIISLCSLLLLIIVTFVMFDRNKKEIGENTDEDKIAEMAIENKIETSAEKTIGANELEDDESELEK